MRCIAPSRAVRLFIRRRQSQTKLAVEADLALLLVDAATVGVGDGVIPNVDTHGHHGSLRAVMGCISASLLAGRGRTPAARPPSRHCVSGRNKEQVRAPQRGWRQYASDGGCAGSKADERTGLEPAGHMTHSFAPGGHQDLSGQSSFGAPPMQYDPAGHSSCCVAPVPSSG